MTTIATERFPRRDVVAPIADSPFRVIECDADVYQLRSGDFIATNWTPALIWFVGMNGR
jgi:hypothetical protein